MSNFMDGFMKGYSFMEGIEDNQRKRDWDDKVQARTVSTWKKEDRLTTLSTAANKLKLIMHDKDNNPLSPEEYTKNPQYDAVMAEVSTLPELAEKFKNANGHYRQYKGAVEQPDGSVAMSVKTFDPKTGQMVMDGVPLTNEGGSGDDEIVTPFQSKVQMDSILQSTLAEIPGWADAQMAARKEAGQAKDLASVLPDPMQQTQPQTQTATPGQQTPKQQQPSTPGKVRGTEPLGTTPTAQDTTATEPAATTSIADRQKQLSKRPVSTRKSGVQILKEAWRKNRAEGVANYFDAMTDTGNTSQLAKNAVREAQANPLEASEKFLKSREAIEAKIGPERTEQLRKDLLDLTTPVAGKADLTDQNKYKRISKVRSELETAGSMTGLSPKSVTVVDKAKATMPAEPKAKQKQIESDQKIVASTKHGTSFNRQAGVNAKARKESVARLILAKVISAEQGDRILRTGRMTKKDVQVVANKNMVGVYDKETEQFKTIATFADTAKTSKAQRDALKDETAGFEKTIKLKYGSDKDNQQRRDTFAQRLSTSVPTWGIDVTQVTKNYGMIARAEDIINGHQGGTGFLGFFKEHPSEYPSLTPGIIAQSLGKRTLSEANTAFFTPIQETKAYGGRTIPEGEARNLANLAVGIHMRNPQMSIEKANSMLVNILNAQGRSIAMQDPAGVLKRLFPE